MNGTVIKMNGNNAMQPIVNARLACTAERQCDIQLFNGAPFVPDTLTGVIHLTKWMLNMLTDWLSVKN